MLGDQTETTPAATTKGHESPTLSAPPTLFGAVGTQRGLVPRSIEEGAANSRVAGPLKPRCVEDLGGGRHKCAEL